MNKTTTLSGQIDLLALVGATFKNINGQDCVIVPTAENPAIFVSTTKAGRQRAYLDILVRETVNNSFGNTHFVKASVGKTNRERLGITKDAIQRYTPIIGNLKPFEIASADSVETRDDVMDDIPEAIFNGF